MKRNSNSMNKHFFDGLVICTIVFILGFTSITVSSSMISTDQYDISILKYDSDLNEKEIQRVIATLNDDVCDDCDDDDDTTMNQRPIAVIYKIGPNPSNEHEIIIFEGYGDDSDGTIIGYRWESNIDGLLDTNASFARSDLSYGLHNITFFVQDNKYLWSDPVNVSLEIFENQAPQSLIIAGSAKIKIGVESLFNIIASDPEQHDIYYYVDWGDGSVEEWSGSYASNEQASFSHTWDQKGGYTIKAKAKDAYDEESAWGVLEVQLTRTKSVNPFLFQEIIHRLIERYPLIAKILQ